MNPKESGSVFHLIPSELYPIKGTPTEALGIWSNITDENSIGVFYIERDGTVSYEDDLAPHNVAIMIDSNHFTIGAYSDLTFDTLICAREYLLIRTALSM